MSACTQCHGQGGFSYRRLTGKSAFAVCPDCRGQRFVDDGEPPASPSPSQLPSWPAPRRSDRISIAGRWLTVGGCLDVWENGSVNFAKEWGYGLGLTGQGIALWNGGAVGILLRGEPLGARGYFLRFSSNDLIAGLCAIRHGPRLPLSFKRDESGAGMPRPLERRRPRLSGLRMNDRAGARHIQTELRETGKPRRADPNPTGENPRGVDPKR